MSKEIVITFEGTSAKVEARNFRGKGCKEATAAYEDVLGLDTLKRVLKPEHNQAEERREIVARGR